MAWCGYKGIIRDVVHCLKVCNGCLFSWLAATACHAKKEQVEWPTGSLDCRCVSGCAQDLLVFPLLREKPRGLCCLVGLSPLEMIPFHALLAFSCLFSAFFFLWIPASLILFFPRMMSFSSSLCLEYCSILKRRGILPCYASMLHFAVL
jgi:hypothetical protein